VWLSRKDQECAGTLTPHEAHTKNLETLLEVVRQPCPFSCAPGALAQGSDGVADISEAGMRVWQDCDSCALQLRARVCLARVQDDEIGAEREDALHVRVEKATHSRDFWGAVGELVEAADTDDLRSGTQRKEDFRHGGDDGDDSLRWRRRLGRDRRNERRDEDERDQAHVTCTTGS
jgi:hypothetical protein